MRRILIAALAATGAACASLPTSTEVPPASTDAGTPGPVTPEPAACTSTRTFFVREVWGKVFKESCLGCHSIDGVAVVRDRAKFVLQPPSYPGFLDENLRTVRELSKIQYEGVSELLVKPSGGMGHGGGAVLDPSGPGYKALEELLRRFATSEGECTDEAAAVSLAGVELLDARRTFRKAALHLAGRLPTTEENAALAAGDDAALGKAIDTLLREPGVLRRVEESWNDLLLTDKYQWKGRNWPVAINILNGTDYPGAAALRTEWDQSRWAPLDDAGKRALNDAVGREPLHLISYVVANDRPFSEVLTADYALVDDGLARAYGVNDGKTGLREAKVTYGSGAPVPHAGILSTPVFLNRWPTTPTNRSRARARFVLKNFLATDILALADRPVDVALVTQQDNPTMNAQQCTVCHATLDPIAGAFRGYDEGDYERFKADRPWHADMFHPGYAGADMPSASYAEGLPWLARQLAADRRFDRAIVTQAYGMVTGHAPLLYPDATGPEADDALAAWNAEDAFFRSLEVSFAASNRNYRKLVRDIVLSPFYRAHAAPEATPSQLARLAPYGTSRLLSPEMLNRKLIALTGVHWRQLWDPDNEHDWFNDNATNTLYGGIESDNVTQRAQAMNGVMSSLAWRMATELTCATVPWEFSRPNGERLLFSGVTMEEIPESAGYEVPGAIANIKAKIAFLFERFTGEPADAVEVDAAYDLFFQTWREIRNGPLRQKGLDWPCTIDPLQFKALPADVRRDADGTIRSWMAVMTYLLADDRVLHE